MNVQKITPIQIKKYSQGYQHDKTESVALSNSENSITELANISFTGIHNIVPKRLNVDLESKKLLRQISEILETDISDLSPEDLLLSSMSKMLSNFRNIQMKMNKLLEKLDLLENDTRMHSKQKIDLLNAYRKEFKILDKMSLTPPKLPNKSATVDDRIDFQLLNRFKVAISKDDYGLLKIYKDYYSGLESIKDLDELSQKYPKIKLPPRPEDVVAKKIVNTLTRDFFENLDELAQKEDYDGIYQLMHKVVKSLCESLTDKYNVDFDSAYQRLSEKAYFAILDKYKSVRDSNSFSSIPINRKVKEAPVTPTDIAMLRVNFDEFVLDVLRRQYLGSEKLNDIVYEGYGVKIPVKSLGNSEYKMVKSSEKIRNIITVGEKIKAAQRDYDAFTPDELKARLLRFSSTKSGQDDILFEKIVEFDSCRFEPEDIEMLRKFLRKLDDYEDGLISLKDIHASIISENIRPKGSELLNELERKNLVEELKLEQKKIFELTSLQDKFDKIIDSLYSNEMSSVAGICSKYRPLSLESSSVAQAEYLIKLISKQVNGSDFNRAKLESMLVNWDTYNFYLTNKSNDIILSKAQAFARNADGTIDIEKAGHYIVNRELVDNYPKSVSFAKYPEFLKKVMSKVSEPDEAVKYLFKYDEYVQLSEFQRTHISELEGFFDLKSSSDKFIFKHIVEDEYANIGTKVTTRLNDKGSETTESTLHPIAKQQIIDKYMFPTCISYLRAFEEALSTVAPTRGATGIKINKGLANRLEAKNKAFEDRLLSSKDDYVFDIYLDKGLHKG